ncbi:MAG: tRNA lysidine(34) synthetase TilS [Sphingomicrobium sp.]
MNGAPKLDTDVVGRFERDLNAVIAPHARIGIAVSGGPDSLTLLLLAAAARPGEVEAATIDHGLRDGSGAEAEMVADVCAGLPVPHAILTAAWAHKPATAIQERAREERYRLLARWARDRQLDAIATAHHLDDQAETLLMRLARGAGVRGLAGIRPTATAPGSGIPLLRPLLGWRRTELEQIVAGAGLPPARDPSNEDEQFERIRIRRALAESDWLKPESLAASAANLRDADAALDWATDQEWARAVSEADAEILYRAADAPPEIGRRIVTRALSRLATEGGPDLRGRELDRLLSVLAGGGKSTLRGVLCTGGETWRFVAAPNRTRPVDNLR